MASVPKHLNWLVNTGERVVTADGINVEVWELRHQSNNIVLSEWARHFRNHYCCDSEIDDFRRGYGYSRGDFLKKIKFPDSKEAPGPSTRAGDFGEILVADYLEFNKGYWVPRARYGAKATNNESTKGCDTIGFHVNEWGKESPNDIMIIFEVKSRLTQDQLTNDKKASGFQSAINDSVKDEIRKACSLNYIKEQLRNKQKDDEAIRIERFQNISDHPYKEIFGAAGVFSDDSYIPSTITAADTRIHPNRDRLVLLVIHGLDLMDLVHELYNRAADEA
jgi:hypothetical protein